MKKKKLIISLILIILLFEGKGFSATKAELEERIKKLEEENQKLRSKLEEMELKLNLILTRMEKLEKGLSSQPSSQIIEPPATSSLAINPTPNLPVVKLKPEPFEEETIQSAPKKTKTEERSTSLEEAKKLFEEKEYKKAKELLIEELGKGENAEVYFWLARVFAKLGEKDSAKMNYKQVIDKFPAHTLAPDAYYELALLQIELGKKAEAKKLLKDLIELYPYSDKLELAKKKLKEL